jgi:4-alpha-glucanotransferase
MRIDHVMRFFRLYWIPEGADAQNGAYVADRYEDLLRVLALESVRNRVILVGEDLGTVEPFFREILARFGVFS